MNIHEQREVIGEAMAGGRSSFAKALIKIRAYVELKDTIVVARNINSGMAKNLKKPNQAPRSVSVGPKVGFKPAKQVYRVVPKKTNANTIGNKKKDVEPPKEKKVDSSSDHDSEDEVASVDYEMKSFLASKKVGYGTNSLLEKLKESYENADYDYDPYDNDMYEGQNIPDKIQSICDKLDIKVRGHKKR
nr:hypothetical protein [Tanacetum cinerariifolium]